MIPIVFAAVAALAGFTGAWQIQAMRHDAAMATIKTEYLKRDFKALENAHADTTRLQTRKDEAERKARARQIALAGDLARVRDVADGLRGELNATRVRLPDAACDAVRRYGVAASVVIGECSARLVEVAGQADRAAGEVMLLKDAWPRSAP